MKGLRAVAGIVGLLALMGGPAHAQLAKVNFALDWIISGRHAGYYVAVEKGWYTGAGLDVTINRGFGGADIQRLASGSSDVSMLDTASVVIARARGAKVKMVSVWYQRAPYVIYTLKKSGIARPKDLEGRSIGAPVADSIRVLFPAFTQLAGIDASKVRWTTMEPAAKVPALLAGKVDAITFYTLETPEMERVTAAQGGINSFIYADYGFEVYSNGLAVTDEALGKNRDVLRRFVQASARGYAYAIDHPDEATEILLKHQGQLQQKRVRPEIDIVKQLALTPFTKERGLGYISERVMGVTRDLVIKYFNLPVPPTRELYTNELLEAR